MTKSKTRRQAARKTVVPTAPPQPKPAGNGVTFAEVESLMRGIEKRIAVAEPRIDTVLEHQSKIAE